jgi:hypothetical protein
MEEDDLVSYRQYTINTTNTNRGGKKRPAPSSPHTTTNPSDHTSTTPKQRVSSPEIKYRQTYNRWFYRSVQQIMKTIRLQLLEIRHIYY